MKKYVRPRVKKEAKNLAVKAHEEIVQEQIEEQSLIDFENARCFYGFLEIWPSFVWGQKEAI